MTKVLVQTLSSGVGEYLPKEITMTFTPWGGYDKYLVVDGVRVVLPEPFDVLLDGKTVQEIEVRPTNQFWCWKVEIKGAKKPYTKYFMVPDTGILEFEQLVEVDPRSFAALHIPPSTQQLIHNANEILQSVEDRSVTATVDPDNENVLLLTFPVYMQSKTNPNLLVLPVGE